MPLTWSSAVEAARPAQLTTSHESQVQNPNSLPNPGFRPNFFASTKALSETVHHFNKFTDKFVGLDAYNTS